MTIRENVLYLILHSEENMDRKETFSNIGGRHFQESLCQIMLEDRPFCDQLAEVIDISFFELKYLQVFTETLLNYRKKYRVNYYWSCSRTF